MSAEKKSLFMDDTPEKVDDCKINIQIGLFENTEDELVFFEQDIFELIRININKEVHEILEIIESFPIPKETSNLGYQYAFRIKQEYTENIDAVVNCIRTTTENIEQRNKHPAAEKIGIILETMRTTKYFKNVLTLLELMMADDSYYKMISGTNFQILLYNIKEELVIKPHTKEKIEGSFNQRIMSFKYVFKELSGLKDDNKSLKDYGILSAALNHLQNLFNHYSEDLAKLSKEISTPNTKN